MTHGDKAKAKTGKSSQASGSKKSSSKAAGKSAESAKGGGKGGRQARPPEKISIKKPAGAAKSGAPAPAPKAVAGPPAKESAAGDAKGRRRPAAAEDATGISNPIIAAAFKHAVKKYPNAFRKLTD